MRDALTAAGCAIVMAALALAPRAAAAQGGPSPFARDDAPALVLNFGAGHVHSLGQEFDDDLYALHAFGGKRRIDRFNVITPLERPTPWKLYGRLGVLNFQNELEPQYSQGLRFSWRRTGPRLTGRIYIGIHRTFD